MQRNSCVEMCDNLGSIVSWCTVGKLLFFFQFGDLLDENADLAFDNTGINAMANKDKASK